MCASSNVFLTQSACPDRFSFERFRGCLAYAAMLTIVAPLAGAQSASPEQMGVAWQVQGEWQPNDRHVAIHDGDAIEAGSLLQPIGTTPDHSIAILLPDGQRVFYECFSSEDCARGFLVPKLMRAPDPFAVEMLAQIRAELPHDGLSARAAASLQMPAPRDELLMALGPGDRVEIGGLAKNLPNGRYVCYAQRIDAGNAEPIRIAVEKSAPQLSLALPEAGIYQITIRDERDRLRIDLLAVAQTADREAELEKPFNRAKALLNEWHQLFHEWPVHELLRAYLQALVLGVKPSQTFGAHAVMTADETQREGIAAQPQFSPRPGYQGGDTAVSLQSATEGATIHFILNGAQPTASSPEYHAPIIVKDLGLTIKAFASAPGMKDSPVVTGTFLIQH
jgi:hypothetical protein